MQGNEDPADPDGRVAACQFEPVVGDASANLTVLREQAAGVDADVVVFPELAVTGYDLETAREDAAPVPGRWTDALADAADEADATLVVGLPERAGADLYNALVAVDGDGVRAVYRKPCLWGDEATVFTSGDEPTTVETPVGTLGFALCYDLNFPEVFTAYARRGVDVVAVSAAWRRSYADDWRLLLRARALDSPCYVVGSNHVGDQHGRRHAGESLVADPTGDVVAEAGAVGPDTVSARVSADVLERGRDRNPVRRTREETGPPWARRR
jgi:predicted amidohydrolase